MLKINFYTDPGHGWAAVKISTLHALGIAGQVSSYSYQKGKTAYLEEDCDFSLLLESLTRAGIPYEIKETHRDRRHWIRSCESYKKPDPVAAAIVARSGVPADRLIVKHIGG